MWHGDLQQTPDMRAWSFQTNDYSEKTWKLEHMAGFLYNSTYEMYKVIRKRQDLQLKQTYAIYDQVLQVASADSVKIPLQK